MKRIIAPLALALLSTVAIADDSNNIQKNFNIIRQYLPETSSSVDNLPAWNNINYKNFAKKTKEFETQEDCIIARDYAMTQVNGKLVINIDDSRYSIVQAVHNNIETRIICKIYYKDSNVETHIPVNFYLYKTTFDMIRYVKREAEMDFKLVYETATRRSDDEIREIKMKKVQEQANARKQHEDAIKSKVDNILNRETLGTSYKLYEPKNSIVETPDTSYKLYEPKNSTVVQPTSRVSLPYHF